MWTGLCVPSAFTPIYSLLAFIGVWLREELEGSLELQELKEKMLRCKGASVLKDAQHPLVTTPPCTAYRPPPTCKNILK